ncbi:MAG: VCBS repeat-containing protein [Phycisphaerae bacterium]|nr:VCBS repeat-containing protein [Phycisphaerae bacterium]
MRTPGRRRLSRHDAWIVILLVGCAPSSPPPDPTPPETPITPTAEVEPNNGLAEATAVAFDASDRARLQGTIPAVEEDVDWDVDYYSLGAMAAGDRIVVTVDASESGLETAVAIFDSDAKLFSLNADTARTTASGSAIDAIIRHRADTYYFVLSRKAGAGTTAGAYEVTVHVDRGGPVVSPVGQSIWLNFTGGTVPLTNGTTLTVDPFDAGAIDASYTGDTATVRQFIVATVRQNYARFNVTVLNSDEHAPPTDTPYSTVYFGGYDPGGLGIAPGGTDPFNANPSDDAVVFTARFTPDLFTNPPDARGLGTAIGNVAAHEIGHLLGLHHVRNGAAVMNAYDAPDKLLTDQRFRIAGLDIFLFPVFSFDLEQDAALLLTEAVGLAPTITGTTVPVGDTPVALATGDFDNDSDVDMAVACSLASQVRVLWNDGTAAFPAHGEATGFGITTVAAHDVDGNGLPDLIVTDIDATPDADSMYVFLNTDTGFSTPVGYTVADGPYSIAVADLDGDGRLDLALAHSTTDKVSMLANAGDGAFGDNTIIADVTFPLAIAAADVDGDGDQDLAYAATGDVSVLGGVTLLINDGTASFTTGATLAGQAIAAAVALVDVNGDAMPDVILVDLFAGAVIVAINDGTGAFATPTSYTVGDSPHAVAVGDLNGDGWPDLAVANADTNDVSILLNRGDGTFEPEWPYRVGAEPQAIVMADLDGDGDLDLAVANTGDDTISILRNNGNGTFE